MMGWNNVLVLSLALIGAHASTWEIENYMFATIAVDVAYVNSTVAVSAVVGFDGYAAIWWTVDDGKSWGPVLEFDGLRMYAGCASYNTPNQSAVVSDIFSFQYADTDQFLFHGSNDPGGFKAQTMDNFGNGFQGDGVSYASVGMRWSDASNGVMVSHDQGHHFEFFNISVLETWARYGAFPSDSVWYVTAGHWPNDNSPPLTPEEYAFADEYPISAALSYRRDPTTKALKPVVNKRARLGNVVPYEWKDGEQEAEEDSDPEVIPPPGWNAQIVKTTDGGQTWVSQYYNRSHFYFNQITCLTEIHCVAVGEGFIRPGKGTAKDPGIHIFLTTDGNTWDEVLFHPSGWISIFAVTFVSDTVVWAAGCDLGTAPITGLFWRSNDGGKTWAIVSDLKGVYPVQLSFLDADHAFAVGPNDADNSALMKYS